MIPVRDDAVTIACPVCQAVFAASGRRRFCTPACRTAAWRARQTAPTVPAQPTRADVVYECPVCEQRYLGEQRCDECNTWCRRVGPGGSCRSCDEPVALADLFDPDQLAPRALPSARRPQTS